MIPRTRDEFKNYCLRGLGDGVIQINMSPEQIEDRIDEALYMYQQFHMDAIAETYLAYRTTGSTMVFTSAPSPTFMNNEPIIGTTSNAKGYVIKTINSLAITYYTNPSNPKFVEGEVVTGTQSGANGTVATSVAASMNVSTANSYTEGEQIGGRISRALGTVLTSNTTGNITTLTFTTTVGTFQIGEEIIGQSSGTSGNLSTVAAAAPGITLGDIDLGYFEVPDDIIAVRRVFPPFDSRISADILFDPQAQFNISLLSNFTSSSIIPYYIGRQYQQLLNDTFRGRPGLRFSRHNNRVYVDVKWSSTLQPAQYFILECSQAINPQNFPDIWSDRWLQRYTTALMKRQWGSNLSKYNGIALPGGVTLDGQRILTDAIQEVKDLEEELQDTFQAPPIFYIG